MTVERRIADANRAVERRRLRSVVLKRLMKRNRPGRDAAQSFCGRGPGGHDRAAHDDDQRQGHVTSNEVPDAYFPYANWRIWPTQRSSRP